MELSILRREAMQLFHIRGQNARATVDGLPIKAPQTFFQFAPLQQLGFVATLGMTEFLVYADSPQSDALASCTDPQTFIFPRDDFLFSVTLPAWRQRFLETCSYDFSKARGGEFIMADMAGVSTWFRVPLGDEPLVFGCDPSMGQYLHQTMQDVLREQRVN